MTMLQRVLPFVVTEPVDLNGLTYTYLDGTYSLVVPLSPWAPETPPPPYRGVCEECLLPHRHDELDRRGMCPSCHWLLFADCHDCHEEHAVVDMVEDNNDNLFCQSCNQDYHDCIDCDERTHDDRLNHVSEGRLCDDCLRDNWSYCDSCDEAVRNDHYHGNGLCDECYSNRDGDDDDDSSLDRYHHTSGLHFHGNPKDGLYYGVELELECDRGERGEAVEATADIFGEFAELKADGSLDHGFEIATAPATPEVHRSHWDRFFDDLPNVSAEDTCGMHVHASREAISPLTLGKLLVFYNSRGNRKFVQERAGRRGIYNGCYNPDKRVTDGKEFDYDRYQAINTANCATIEFRIFASTTSRSKFFARFEFVQATILYCKLHGINSLSHEEFCMWVSQHGRAYPALHKELRTYDHIPNRPIKRATVTIE